MDSPFPNVSGQLARTIVALYGDAGTAWLAGLPALLDECARRWSLTLLPPFANLSYNYVAPAVAADGSAVVLKLGVPNRELLTEAEALRIYAGRGSIRLLGGDPEAGILLLERVRPGATLADTIEQGRGDDAATAAAAEVMRQLWRPVPPDHAFPTVAGWALALGRLRAAQGGGSGPLPERLLALAESLFAELLGSSAAPVVLHGDLHHWNILAAERQPWLAIDPKGVVGEPAYEVGALLRNPMPAMMAWPDLPRLLARRVDVLAETLGFDRERILAWGAAQAVLSACWNVEDGDDVAVMRRMIALAEILAGMLS